MENYKHLRLGSLLTLMLFLYYLSVYLTFFKTDTTYNSPVLKERLGTILWQSALKPEDAQFASGQSHIYCFYPKAVNNQPKPGEEIINRVQSIDDCHNWYGSVFIYESEYASEKDKIYWPNPTQDNNFLGEKIALPNQVENL